MARIFTKNIELIDVVNTKDVYYLLQCPIVYREGYKGKNPIVRYFKTFKKEGFYERYLDELSYKWRYLGTEVPTNIPEGFAYDEFKKSFYVKPFVLFETNSGKVFKEYYDTFVEAMEACDNYLKVISSGNLKFIEV